jgi:L-seryl-tRNA(Ser) seleniumtransferase
MGADPRRGLPSVDRLAREIAPEGDATALPAWAAREGARQAIAEARHALAEGSASLAGLGARARELAQALAAPAPRRVVNATGVVLHTNLGRAVLAEEAVRAVASAAAGYTDLEIALPAGSRGDRTARLGERLRLLSGAEAAFAVNNGAAAVLLALETLARGREAVVSRGELVEIGGSYRVPEIVERAGVRLVEVGTTNRTHPRDFEAAIGPATAVLLKVHRSNFEQRGFVSEVDLAELVAIGRRHGIPVVEDLGSATLVDLRSQGLPPESYAPSRLEAGADLVCFSGDKLLGGPQAGILLGRAARVEQLRRNPLARALRLDKLCIAALDATLGLLLEDRAGELPALRGLLEPVAVLAERAEALAEQLRAAAPAGLRVAAVATRAPAGGGSLPGFEQESVAVALEGLGGAEALAAALRGAPVAVLGRVAEDRLLLDVRTLLPGDEVDVVRAVAALVA